jgi:hypothetical protein
MGSRSIPLQHPVCQRRRISRASRQRRCACTNRTVLSSMLFESEPLNRELLCLPALECSIHVDPPKILVAAQWGPS